MVRRYNPNFDKVKARNALKKEEKKLKEARKKILSIADTEYKIDLKSDVEDVKRAKTNIKKEEAIERAHKRRKSRAKVYSDSKAKRKQEGISFNKGGQGYAAREDESLGMRTGAERTKSQSMRDRRDESYGAFGKRPNQKINRGSGGGTPSKTISDKDAIAIVTEIMGEDSRTISNADRERAAKIVEGKTSDEKKNKKPKSELPEYRRNRNMGGTMKNYRHGGVDIEFRDEEGSRLSISMERQEDAGYSPSEADFDKQHSLAEEGIMEVGADVKIIQGYNSPSSLGETDTVRGTGAMVKGTKFRGSF